MKRFLIKLLLFLLPLFVILGIYFLKDPFKVLYKYQSYYQDGKPLYVNLNRDYVTLETLKNNYPKDRDDSYIFGNSRSMFFKTHDWDFHIRSIQSFHFDASGESLYGLHAKVQYLKKNGMPIKNALVIFDHELLAVTENQKRYLIIKHPQLSGESTLSWQYFFLKSFLNQKFLLTYIDFIVSGKIKNYMLEDYTLDNRIVHYDPKNNELSLTEMDQMIANNRDSFYNSRMSIFYTRAYKDSVGHPVISEQHLKLLNEIKQIFDEKKTSYRIIISPLYDQLKLNPKDLAILKQIFGNAFVYDYSGTNSITNDIHNYYENSHFVPTVAKRIIDEVYK